MAEEQPEGKPEQPEPGDDLVTTAHSITVEQRRLDYTATTGRMVLRSETIEEGKFEGHKPKAEMFVTAYTLDGADVHERPVVFAFNGGPGASSIWLHMGLLGPRRVVSGDAGALEPPPYRLVDNAETLLAHADLVFVDPVSTGYSRATKGNKPGEYHGFTADIESVGEIIRLWVSRNGRWMSPKFLAGESYGTVRAGALAEHLQQRHGMFLNGLMLISSILDMGTVVFSEGNDRPYSFYLPTYAAIANYHGCHGERPLAEVIEEAEAFADKEYPYALAQGARLPAHERANVVAKLAELTGLDEDYIERANLRIEHLRFFAELLRDRELAIGRMDGRFTGASEHGVGEQISADPFMQIAGSYVATFNHYVRAELGYDNDLPYEYTNPDVLREWSYKEFENASTTVTDKLAGAMRGNEFLKVHVAFGYYDGATPHHAAEYCLANLRIPERLRGNIERAYYEAGHMMYVHEPSRVQQGTDLARFVRTASNR